MNIKFTIRLVLSSRLLGKAKLRGEYRVALLTDQVSLLDMSWQMDPMNGDLTKSCSTTEKKLRSMM